MNQRLKELLEELDFHLTNTWEEYIDLHEKLDKSFGGKQLDDSNVEEANALLHEIQNMFNNSLYPAYHFIRFRSEGAQAAIHGYEKFIASLVKNGAKENVEVKE